jgi:hypothetical protein
MNLSKFLGILGTISAFSVGAVEPCLDKTLEATRNYLIKKENYYSSLLKAETEESGSYETEIRHAQSRNANIAMVSGLVGSRIGGTPLVEAISSGVIVGGVAYKLANYTGKPSADTSSKTAVDKLDGQVKNMTPQELEAIVHKTYDVYFTELRRDIDNTLAKDPYYKTVQSEQITHPTWSAIKGSLSAGYRDSRYVGALEKHSADLADIFNIAAQEAHQVSIAITALCEDLKSKMPNVKEPGAAIPPSHK